MAELADEILEALDAVTGAVHAGHRTQHAKGLLLGGTFTASPRARELSRAAHFSGEPARVVARFSNGGGDPHGMDGDPREGRGLAVKFSLPGGATTDIVALTLPVFFVRTPEDFLAIMRARRPDFATGKPDMEKLGAFVGAHPETQAALGLIFPALAPPVSYATRAYNSLHAFWLVAPDGTRRAGRWRFTPEAGEHNLAPEEARRRAPDYLREEILARGEVRFRLDLTLAADGDPLDDATAPWPEDREAVDMGTLVLTGPDRTRERDGDVLVFDPTRLTDGIELTDDPLPPVRSAVYERSVFRRTGVARRR